MFFTWIGHGSIFFIQPVWFLAVTGATLQILLFINHEGNSYIYRAMLLAITSSVLAAILMAINWGDPVLSIFGSGKNYIFLVLFVFSVPLSLIVSKFIRDSLVENKKNTNNGN